MRQKPRILFIGRFPPPVHGAAVMNEFYFNSIEINKNFTLKRIAINKKGPFEEIGKVSLKNFWWFIKSYLRLIKKLISFKPDLIYFELAPNGIAFYRDSLYIILCKLFKKRVIFHLHARNLERNSYSKFIFKDTKIIILSKLLNNEVESLFKKEQRYILPNGIPNNINDSEFLKIIQKREKIRVPNLLFLSNMIEEKGTIDFLKICDYLKDKKIKFKAIFVGSWPDEKTRRKWFSLRNSLNLQNYCIYVGEKFNEEKRKVLEQSQFMVFPTTYKNESFPLVILEVFMFGVPVFSYDNGAIKEMISRDYLGKVVKKEDWGELAKELEKRLRKKTESEKIRQYFKKNYIFKVAEKKLIKIWGKELK